MGNERLDKVSFSVPLLVPCCVLVLTPVAIFLAQQSMRGPFEVALWGPGGVNRPWKKLAGLINYFSSPRGGVGAGERRGRGRLIFGIRW